MSRASSASRPGSRRVRFGPAAVSIAAVSANAPIPKPSKNVSVDVPLRSRVPASNGPTRPPVDSVSEVVTAGRPEWTPGCSPCRAEARRSGTPVPMSCFAVRPTFPSPPAAITRSNFADRPTRRACAPSRSATAAVMARTLQFSYKVARQLRARGRRPDSDRRGRARPPASTRRVPEASRASRCGERTPPDEPDRARAHEPADHERRRDLQSGDPGAGAGGRRSSVTSASSRPTSSSRR